MANYDLALQHLLKVEGGLVNDPSDPGGITDYGISLRFLHAEAEQNKTIMSIADYDHNGDIDANDIKHLTPEVAAVVYKYAFWVPNNYAQFSDNIGVKLLDMSVNTGATTGNIMFQKALNSLRVVGQTYIPIPDGNLGPQTVMRYNLVTKAYSEQTLLLAIRNQQVVKYDAIIANNPSLAKYRVGWINRVNSC